MTATIVAAIVIIGLIINGLRLRARVPHPLPPAPPPGTPAWDDPPAAREWAWLTARGMTLDTATRRAAAALAGSEELDLLELIPADLPVTTARDLLRRVDPQAYHGDRLALGYGAGTVVMADQAMAWRAAAGWASAGQQEDWRPGQPAQATRAEPTDVVAAIRRLRPYARDRGAAIVVAPGLRAGGLDLARRPAWLRANDTLVAACLATDAVPYLLTVAVLVTGSPWGVAAAVAYCLQPYLIFAGTPLRPRGLHAAALLRLAHAPWTWARTAAGRWRSAADLDRAAAVAEATAYYQAALAEGTGRFLEPRRQDCPWCGSTALFAHLRSPEVSLAKPGTFTLDRCGGCGHIFQNPRLTLEGLGFYYRDDYDGLGAADRERMFAMGGDFYLGRARMVAAVTTPKAWLDVGTGHAHFCALARSVLPDTVFDGLDQGAGIEEAERRGWIGTGYRGEFPALAGDLAGRYDVVSMHHYLEHTLDPRRELDAAAHVLRPGGHLLIELPDPEWRLAPLLRHYWVGWFQPQHLHMMPIHNLIGALAERGLRPVAVERGPAHQEFDFVVAALLLSRRLAGVPAAPWAGRPATAAARVRQAVAWTAAAPAIALGLLIDRTLTRALARRWDRGNAYRVLARREEEVTVNDR
jgi:SAM-dependent methyltransferase